LRNNYLPRLLLLVFGLLASGGIYAQDDVKYKKTSDEVNRKAQARLEHLFGAKGGEAQAATLFDDVVVCGPLLWEQLLKSNGELLAGKTMMIAAAGISHNGQAKPAKLEARGFTTPQEVQAFKDGLLKQIVSGQAAKVRRAREAEIRYYWATIPFDIEEPLFAADLDRQRLVINFRLKDGEPKIFWIDLVGEVAPAQN